VPFNQAIVSRFKDQAEILLLADMQENASEACSYFIDGYHPNKKGARCIAYALFQVV